MNKDDLLKLIEEDDLGLLVVKPKSSNVITADERLVASFCGINNFVKENNREPDPANGVQEHQLAMRLKSIRDDEKKSKSLLDFDELNLLNLKKKEIKTVSDIFGDDDFGLLDASDDLFKLKHVSKYQEKEKADFIAHRKRCKDFDKFEDAFKQCQADLASGNRRLIKFTSDKQVIADAMFVVSGILLYVEKIGETKIDKYGKVDGRIRCIFENGTESGMLLRSLVKRLYENGQAVSETTESTNKKFFENFNAIDSSDKQTGYIYILKSLSKNPRIQDLEYLYKIGFSNTPVEDRIKNASEEPTYLMAPVAIVSTFECYNFNPQKLEQLLHNFFGSACLNIDIFDKNNQRHMPREWFIAPIDVIEQTVRLIISGGIVNYKYDVGEREIVYR